MSHDQGLYSGSWKPLWHVSLSNSYFAPAAFQVLALFSSCCLLTVFFSQGQCFILVLEIEFRPDFTDLTFHLCSSGPCFLLLVRMLPLLCSYILDSFYIEKKATSFYLCWFGVFLSSCSAKYHSLYLSFLLRECCNTKNSHRRVISWKGETRKLLTSERSTISLSFQVIRSWCCSLVCWNFGSKDSWKAVHPVWQFARLCPSKLLGHSASQITAEKTTHT